MLKQSLLLLLPAIGLIACNKAQEPILEPYIPQIEKVSSSTSSEKQYNTVLFNNLTVQESDNWFVKSNAVAIELLDSNFIKIKMSRLQGENSDFTSLGIYLLQITDDGKYIEPFGTGTRYIDSEWKGNGTRYLTPDEEHFNTLHKGSVEKIFNLDCLPVTPLDKSSIGSECLNIAEMVNKGKVVLGFLPSNNAVSFSVEFLDAQVEKYNR